ncbi:Hypothetical protein, putative, partial [Bodo saltans]
IVVALGNVFEDVHCQLLIQVSLRQRVVNQVILLVAQRHNLSNTFHHLLRKCDEGQYFSFLHNHLNVYRVAECVGVSNRNCVRIAQHQCVTIAHNHRVVDKQPVDLSIRHTIWLIDSNSNVLSIWNAKQHSHRHGICIRDKLAEYHYHRNTNCIHQCLTHAVTEPYKYAIELRNELGIYFYLRVHHNVQQSDYVCLGVRQCVRVVDWQRERECERDRVC